MQLPRSSSSETQSKMRPLIGLTSRLDDKSNFYLRRYYSEAVAAAGGTPALIPLIPDREYLSALMDRLDGVLLSGSASDLDPIYYGEEPHPKLGQVTPERDETDLILLEIIEERRLPLLAICFGHQSLNVSRGGSLIQDIDSQVGNPIKHEQGLAFKRASHHVELKPDSLLARLAGSNTVRVNSTHHQAVKRTGRNLKVIGQAPDGVIEAVIDDRPDRFVLGVQWHPEINWERDKFSQAIFQAFIEAAR